MPQTVKLNDLIELELLTLRVALRAVQRGAAHDVGTTAWRMSISPTNVTETLRWDCYDRP
jgi:hypothetical protein